MVRYYKTKPSLWDWIVFNFLRSRKREIIYLLHLIDRVVLSENIHTESLDDLSKLSELSQTIVHLNYESASRICMAYIPSVQGDHTFQLNTFIFELHDYINNQRKPIHFASKTVYWVHPSLCSRKDIRLVRKVLREINRVSVCKDYLF